MYGSGPLLLCLHGYNHHTRSFHFLGKRLQHRFTILAIDLPYHGFTTWKEKRPFTPEDLHEIILQIQPQASKGMHILGYSMGGRFSLAYFQEYATVIKSIALVAPDGLRINPWYRAATHTQLGRKIFHNTMHNPAWLYRLIRTTDRFKLAKKGLTNTAMYFLQNEKGRMELYNRWTSLSLFRPQLRTIQKLLQKYQVPVQMLFGKTDPVISWKDGLRFQKGCPQWIHSTIVPAGHFLMNERFTDEIIKLLPE
jgi:pimeloyl-ACP methyl ester carboxylesterase